MSMENIDIRRLVCDSGLTYAMIAEEMGISRVWLSNLMRYQMTDDNKQKVMDAINVLIEKRNNTASRPHLSWTRCDEKLPKDSDSVLVCFNDEMEDGSDSFLNWGIGMYGEIEKEWYVDGWEGVEVVAWMTLPELPDEKPRKR